ncbi:semaphorin-1A-like isoform X3 [Daphnia carinata]|uniref:semaphorin-1A-like isoform X3 n=1 Tax=Daphnia carinata TaxID=120202 RepID=UPI00286889BA|nr:semaphorin-1A-like isoform X3 [Daphnia carinata]
MASSDHTERRRSSNAMPCASSASFCQRRTVFRPRLKSLLPLCYLMATMSCWTSVGAGWQDDIQPRRSITLAAEQVQRFHGNHSHPDHFKLLETNGDSILVGARNIIYNLSLNEMTENRAQRVEWYPASTHREMCLVKGKSEDDCQNYIRVLARINDEEMLVCGTNAYNPLCRRYGRNASGVEVLREFSGKGLSPYDPNHNSTAVFSDGELYAGTVSDFSGLDPLIYKDPLRTEQYDFKHLNAPNFVSSVADGDYVYFFLRETAVEYINCGKTVYSRVGRVCKNDKGGPHRWSNRWTSFLKSRLNCSLPGDFPFYFDEIQSTSDVVEGTYGRRTERLIYGVFTTPENSIYGSAICAYRLQDVMDSFDGAFKEQTSMNANWLPVSGNDVPEPRPGQCVNDSRTLPEVTLNFIKSHSLMDESVPAFYGLPLVTHTSLKYKFTKLAVDPQVRTADGKTYDILIIGTDKGKVIRAINTESYDSINKVRPVIIEEIKVFETEAAITNLRVIPQTETTGPRLIVVSNDEIQTIPLHRCYTDSVITCSECVALQDPYCAWNAATSRCVTVASVAPTAQSGLIQSIFTGYSDQCPDNAIVKTKNRTPSSPSAETVGLDVELETNVIVEEGDRKRPFIDPGHDVFDDNVINAAGPKVGASQSSFGIYTAETFTIAVVVSCFASLIVGFLSGLMFSRRCKIGDSFASSSGGFSGAPYLEQRRLSRLNETNGSCNEPSKMNNFVDSLNSAVLKMANEKNNANTNNTTSTLDLKPAVQKVKKTYV